MTDPAERTPFVPLPTLDRRAPAGAPVEASPPDPVVVVYLVYRDPEPLEFPGTVGLLPGPVFHAAGVLLREDDTYLALGEVAFVEENRLYAAKYGTSLFPAYRHVLTIPKASVLERRTMTVAPRIAADPTAPPASSGPPVDASSGGG